MKVGDVVILKGHTKPMTIIQDKLDHNIKVRCAWYDSNYVLNTFDFKKDALKLISKDE